MITMKIQIFKSKALLLSMVLVMGLSLSISAQEVRKEISENFKVSKDFALGIDSKYGNINIVNWDKNELDVKVEIVVEATSDAKAQKILNNIEIEINKGAKGVDFVTNIEMMNFGKNTSVEVNYIVNAPSFINVNLLQKYGSIYLEEITGDANITVKYGSLKAQSLVNAKGNTNDLTMAYSEGVIKSCAKINAKLTYSELDFGTVLSYEGKLAYSELSIQDLTGKFVSSAAYSEIDIANVAVGFETVDVEIAFGDVTLLMDAKASYSYLLDTKFGSLDAPEGAVQVNKIKDDVVSFSNLVKGSVGNSSGGKVTVVAKYGDVKVE